MNRWKALLLVYPEIDVRYRATWWRTQRFRHRLPAAEIGEAEDSFRHFPPLVNELTDGRASIDYAIVHVERPLRSLSAISWGGFWPSPEDTAQEIAEYAPVGRFDSLFLLWQQTNFVTGAAIPSGGWGFGMGASEATNGATYATVANARTELWQVPRVGEVWLHEWLHGVCYHFAQRGYTMPDGDADGGGRHGYVQSPTTGWTDYYRDLMNGRVRENGGLKGIASTAWLAEPSTRLLPA
jgi:hypothetical protein